MSFITLILLIILLLGFTTISYFQVKKVKSKISQIISGSIEDCRLSEQIRKARSFSKNKFIIYYSLSQSLIFSTAGIIIVIGMNLVFATNRFNPIKHLVVFVFLFTVFLLNGIFKANSIWLASKKHIGKPHDTSG